MLAIPRRAIHDRNPMSLRPAAHPTTEATRHPHQMGVVKGLIGTGQLPPPQPEPAGGMPQTKVGIENNAVDTIITSAQELRVQRTHWVGHNSGGYLHRLSGSTKTSNFWLLTSQFCCPARGHSFGAKSPNEPRFLPPKCFTEPVQQFLNGRSEGLGEPVPSQCNVV